MEFAGGEINASHSGALQDFEIRDAICDVMEGGRDQTLVGGAPFFFVYSYVELIR